MKPRVGVPAGTPSSRRTGGCSIRHAARFPLRLGSCQGSRLAGPRAGRRVTLLDLLVVQGSSDPDYTAVIQALHKARHGDPAELDALIAGLHAGQPVPAELFSWGLYTASFCSDLRFPWGDSSAPLHQRQAALDRRVAGLRRQEVWPYDRRTVAGLGFIQRCLHCLSPGPLPNHRQPRSCHPSRRCCSTGAATCPRRWSGPWKRPFVSPTARSSS